MCYLSYWTVAPSCWEPGLTQSVSPQYPEECRHSAKAGLSVKLKTSSLLKWGLAQPQIMEGCADTGGNEGLSWPQQLPRKKPGQCGPASGPVVGRQGKGQNGISRCTPWGVIWADPHTGQAGQECLSVCQKECQSCSAKTWLSRTRHVLHSGQLLNLTHETLIIALLLSKFPVRLRLGHNSWHQMLHTK